MWRDTAASEFDWLDRATSTADQQHLKRTNNHRIKTSSNLLIRLSQTDYLSIEID